MDPAGTEQCVHAELKSEGTSIKDLSPSPSSDGSAGVDPGNHSARATSEFTDTEEARLSTPSKYDHGILKIIRNATPSWFSICMGTGITSILLFNLPYNGAGLYWISILLFGLNVFLFVLFLIFSILRYVLYPKLWLAVLRHPTQSLFLGTFPMALATIIEMIVYACVPHWGPGTVTMVWVLWWIDCVISVATCCYLPFVIMYQHDTKLSTMTAAWLLPVVSTIVASATGSIIAPILPHPQQALITITVSYVLWGMGVPLAMSILVIYFHRLTVHNFPPREVIVSVFLPLGPCGQGAFAIMQLGKGALELFPRTGTLQNDKTNAGAILYVGGWAVAIILWGFGLVWFFFAIASMSRSRFPLPFNMGWWGFTFPIGVFAIATTTFGTEMESRFFRVLGTIISAFVALLWIVVAIRTLKRAISGELFVAPCLRDLEGKQETARRHFGEANSEV